MNFARDTIIYLKNSVKALLKYPRLSTFYSCIKYYPAWKAHLEKGKNPLTDKTPWISFSAIHFLKTIARPDMYVFEYGSGGSSLFWASAVKQVTSVEHDRLWYERMQKALISEGIKNIEYLLIEAQPDPVFSKKDYRNPLDYISSDPEYSGKNFEEYVKTIDRYPDAYWDIIAVDGRSRPSCIKHALSKLKTGGYLIVDNSERKYYTAPFGFNKQSWKIWKFAGPVPYSRNFSETTIFKKLLR